MNILKHHLEESPYDSRFFNRQEGYRYLIETNEKDYVEAGVYLHYKDNTKKAVAVDISCMVGCQEKCFFCSSSNLEYKRNLTADEMAEEALLVLNQHSYMDFDNVVFAFHGIGESSFMSEQIIAAIKLLRNTLPNSIIKISTTCSNIEALNIWKESSLKNVQLQISITNYSTKDFKSIEHIIEYIDKHNIADYFTEIRFNYILINQQNDNETHLQNLISIFKEKPYAIKLSKLNHCINSQYISSNADTFKHFSDELHNNGIKNYIFGSRIDSSIGCGQLLYLNNNQK